MGQSATLYRIGKNDFSKIIDNPNDFSLFSITKGYQIFEGSFAGLQFILSKGLNEKNRALIDQIFDPKVFIGEKIDFSKIDFENLPDDFDFEHQPIYYHDSNKVSEISKLLKEITVEIFKKNFDHIELNKHDIYPGNIWNDKTEEDIAFNITYMSIEFHNLKSIFKIAEENGGYLLIYIG